VICDPNPTSVSQWTRHMVGLPVAGPAFVSVADMNDDGLEDLVVSAFGTVESHEDSTITVGNGSVSIFLQGETLGCWEKRPVLSAEDGAAFPNHTTVEDVDGDGDLDIFVPFGFFACQFDPERKSVCGALAWFENRGADWERHDILSGESSLFYHGVEFVDFDGDGVKDVVTTGETSSSAITQWFKGDPSLPSRFESEPREIGEGLGALPSVADIDGDGDLDVASAEYFEMQEDGTRESFAWFERVAHPSDSEPAGQWQRHTIDAESGPSIHFLPVDDLYGDGVRRWLGSNHTNTTDGRPDPESAVFAYEVPEDPTQPWVRTKISTGIVSRPIDGLAFQAAPGLVGHGDIDGDGDIDVAVAGDGDARTYWLEQTAPGEFSTHVIEEVLGQASGALVADLNGDGKNELVFSGFEDDVVYVYEGPGPGPSSHRVRFGLQ
jgi:hypothetical protein